MDHSKSPRSETVRGTELSFSSTHEMTHPHGCLSWERAEHSIQATSLVHEAYLRLVEIERLDWRDRAHFFAMAARVMRRILVDHARSRGCSIHGGNLCQVHFDMALIVSGVSEPSLARLDEALTALGEFDPRKAQVVEMRYFAGLTSKEIASVLGISQQSVNRDWTLAKAWLARDLSHGESHGTAALGSD